MKKVPKNNYRSSLCIVAMIVGLTGVNLYAGQITNVTWYSGVASVAGTIIQPLVEPNNDNAVGISSNSFIVAQKHYTGIGPVDLVFDVVDTGGTVEFAVYEGVDNSTGLDWSGYHIELGFGSGAGFVKSGLDDDLDFDYPHYDSLVDFISPPGFFPSLAVTQDDLIASGGVMPNFSYGEFTFHIDVPDGITEFTVRQSPIAVPEPASLGLMSLVAGGFYFVRRFFVV
jgi:hypothetical protein